MTRLIMFTDAYPYSTMNAWKGQELAVFRERFDEVHVAPLLPREAEVSPDLPSGVQVLPPVYAPGEAPRSVAARARDLAGRRLLRHLALVEPVRKLGDLRKFLAAAAQVEHIFRSAAWRAIEPLLPGSALYFFWGRGYAQILPYLPRVTAQRALVRMHRWDLYADVNQGYIPYQRRILERAGIVAPISQDGVDHLREAFPGVGDPRCIRLGTRLGNAGSPSRDGELRVISCAYARPVKRLHLIPEALGLIDAPVHWTHIGDGPEFDRLRALADRLPAHIEARILGKVAPDAIPDLYAGQAFDLFLNVSESEGIPVSIMEAMAAGIVPIATDVGGSGELVRGVGKVVPKNVSAKGLTDAILEMGRLSPAKRDALRDACRARVAADYDIERNASAVADALLSLRSP